MAVTTITKRLPSNLLLLPLRTLSTQTITSPSPPLTLEAAQSPILDLSDTSKLFSTTPTTWDLLLSLFNLYLMSIDPIVDLGTALMRSPVMDREKDGILRRTVMRINVKRTVSDHFCAGEDLKEAERSMEGLWEEGLKVILDYGLEDADGNEDCDRNLGEFLKTVRRYDQWSSAFVCKQTSTMFSFLSWNSTSC